MLITINALKRAKSYKNTIFQSCSEEWNRSLQLKAAVVLWW
jgi:hypothetical protein